MRLKDGRRGRLALDLDVLRQATFNKSTFFEETPPEGERVEMTAGRLQDSFSKANRATQKRIEENYASSQSRLRETFAPANQALMEFFGLAESNEPITREQMEADLRHYERSRAADETVQTRVDRYINSRYGSADKLRQALGGTE